MCRLEGRGRRDMLNYPVFSRFLRFFAKARGGKAGFFQRSRCSAVLLLLLLAANVVLPGCSNQPAVDEVVLNIDECADRLRETIAFQDVLTALDAQMIAMIYRIPAEDVRQQRVYAGTGATAEEIAVFEAVDADALQRIETAVWQRVADQKSSFEDYLPMELPKLEDPFVLVKGNYVILCISDHNEGVKAELEQLFK